MNHSNSPNNATTASPATASSSSTGSIVDFLTVARGLKTTLRTGWVRQEASPRIESVADHSWRISLMAMVAAGQQDTDSGVDTNRLLQMALVHDLAESTVGDITPHCGVSDKDKYQMELDAMQKLTDKLGEKQGKHLLDLWKEYEKGESMEAKLCKDLDKLEMILQAQEYETDGQNKKSLDGFFDSTRDKWRTELGAAWGAEIEARRPSKTKATTDSTEEPSSKKQKTSEE